MSQGVSNLVNIQIERSRITTKSTLASWGSVTCRKR
jgi:hypothetical protein